MASKLYNHIIRIIDPRVPTKLRTLWEHPAGPKTVFFWAPMFKWGLVIAGIGDLTKPVDTLSITQAGVVALTGAIWTRYAMVIVPKNWSLFSVNFFVTLTQGIQFIRAFSYHQTQKRLEQNKSSAA